MGNLNHLEMVKHIRTCIKRYGIKAYVRKQTICGDRIIQVNTIKHDVEFTDDEQRKIRRAALSNKLTWVRNSPIDVERMTNPYHFNFHM